MRPLLPKVWRCLTVTSSRKLKPSTALRFWRESVQCESPALIYKGGIDHWVAPHGCGAKDSLVLWWTRLSPKPFRPLELSGAHHRANKWHCLYRTLSCPCLSMHRTPHNVVRAFLSHLGKLNCQDKCASLQKSEDDLAFASFEEWILPTYGWASLLPSAHVSPQTKPLHQVCDISIFEMSFFSLSTLR